MQSSVTKNPALVGGEKTKLGDVFFFTDMFWYQLFANRYLWLQTVVMFYVDYHNGIINSSSCFFFLMATQLETQLNVRSLKMSLKCRC